MAEFLFSLFFVCWEGSLLAFLCMEFHHVFTRTVFTFAFDHRINVCINFHFEQLIRQLSQNVWHLNEKNFVHVQNSLPQIRQFLNSICFEKKRILLFDILFILLVIACCDGVFFLQSTTKCQSWSIVKFNPVFMLSECKASAQQSTNFNQNFWSWYLNKECCIHSHSTMNHSPVQCHIASVSILFSLSIEFCHSNALQSMECVFQQSIFSPCISNAQLFVDLCVCVPKW